MVFAFYAIYSFFGVLLNIIRTSKVLIFPRHHIGKHSTFRGMFFRIKTCYDRRATHGSFNVCVWLEFAINLHDLTKAAMYLSL